MRQILILRSQQFLPQHWRLDHLTEALVFRNLPFDTKGDLTRLLLHYLEEFLSVKLQPINLALNYTLLINLRGLRPLV